jgi:hypothetical protein
MDMVSHQDVFESWDRDQQNAYLADLAYELDVCQALARIPKIINAEAEVVVRFDGTQQPIIEEA